MWMRRRITIGAVMGALMALCAPVDFAQSGPTVFAAASLKNAMDEIGTAWTASGKPAARVSLAASNTLAKQIEQGAPADLFFSADLDWMDFLAGKALIRPETRVSLLANALVLIGPEGRHHDGRHRTKPWRRPRQRSPRHGQRGCRPGREARQGRA